MEPASALPEHATMETTLHQISAAANMDTMQGIFKQFACPSDQKYSFWN
jgi:hypothetical protein